MYNVYLLTIGNKELLDSFETRKEASAFEDAVRKSLRKGNNLNGEYADVTTISTEEEKRIAEACKRWDALTEEEKADVIEIDGRTYVRAIYEANAAKSF